LDSAAGDTLARMFWRRVEARGLLDAQLVRRQGSWHRLTWTEVGEAVREVALGLLALGRPPQEPVALLSASRAEWVQADFAILSVLGVTVPIYPTCTADQIVDIVNDSGARTIFVEDPDQLARVRGAQARMPKLEHVVVIEGPTGRQGPVLAWEELRRLGRMEADRLRDVLVERIGAARPEDVATVVYTSGTTGEPKGVVQTHANHMAMLRALAQLPGVQPGDVHLLFLPLAHSFARVEAFMAVHRGLVTAFAEGLSRLADDLREVRPCFLFGVPRVFEKARDRILADIEARSPLARGLCRWAMSTGRAVSTLQQAGRPVPWRLRLQHRLAHRAVLSRLQRAFGGRLRFAVSGGAPLEPEVAEFFHAIGILIVEGYGLTEACPALTFNRLDKYRFGSAGQAVPGVELRIAADGEILARGPNVAVRGYLNKPAATAETFDRDGWLHTGDVGRLDAEGFLHITDRKKEVIITSGGVNIAPQHVEHLLKRDPLVGQAMLCGDRRPYPTALIALDADVLARFAAERGLGLTDYAALARHPEVTARVQRAVEAANAELQSYAQVKRFAVVLAPFTEEAGELTPTQKVKRRVVAKRYGELISSLYRPG
jgi:long-chain acyl-CoA synthetase